MRFFQIYEIIDRDTYYKYSERETIQEAWKLFTPDLLYSLDGLRDFLGSPISVNNWWGNTSTYARQYCGYRPPECTVGAQFSQHRMGNAADCHIKGADYDKMRLHIMENKDDERLIKIMRIEATVPWLHIDMGKIPKGRNRIYLFRA
ncbi:MAG: D-Ala-D-Ala carboxypeptidase family metallohydrolase [Methanolobus sp.]|uniref:D-Ala-D-Ala carboxypeptidase family metallohydrolase n=1 Tax=Methanolobus sp. TaxID=1874737 RepID=UPI002730E54B|nr:D-Ala-D-Ala carboxypeptidase family metallohydrolase [Methanolobus sp.]MDP2218518.1 D-Ala-D-Ala carboxypeptidase family metallohydrolase [Methanolobus sp.]